MPMLVHFLVNSTFIGWIWGPTVIAYFESLGGDLDEHRGAIAAGLPLRRVPTDEECAAAVLLFLSDHAGPITGALIDISAGAYFPA